MQWSWTLMQQFIIMDTWHQYNASIRIFASGNSFLASADCLHILYLWFATHLPSPSKSTCSPPFENYVLILLPWFSTNLALCSNWAVYYLRIFSPMVFGLNLLSQSQIWSGVENRYIEYHQKVATISNHNWLSVKQQNYCGTDNLVGSIDFGRNLLIAL